jgi:Transglycosylase-like domain
MSGSTSTLGFSSLAAMVQHFESGGNYGVTTKTAGSTASGAYQFTNQSWQAYATAAGVDTSQYPTAASAPPAVQDAVFANTVQSVGLQPWTCSGCDPALSSYIAQNPTAASLPISGYGANTAGNGTFAASPNGGGTTGNSTVYDGYDASGNYLGGTTDPSAYPIPGASSYSNVPSGSTTTGGTGSTGSLTGAGSTGAGSPGELLDEPFSFGLTSGLAQAVDGWISSAETATGNAFRGAMSGILGTAQNWFLRFILILVGLVILTIALWRIVDPDGSKTRTVVEAAAA